MRLPRLSLPGTRVEVIDDGLVKEVRLEPVGADALLRIVLEGAAADVKASALHDPFRLVLDVYRPREGPSAGAGQPGIEPLRLIVLDAGHGGHDPGATGPSGLREKEVVLDVTRRVTRMVEEDLGDQGGAHPEHRRLRAAPRPHQLRQQAARRSLRLDSRQCPSARGVGRGGDLLPVLRGLGHRCPAGGRGGEWRDPAREPRPRGPRAACSRASSGTWPSPSSSRSRASWPRRSRTP